MITYTYDGDGVLAMREDAGGVTRYAGEHYEHYTPTGDAVIGEVGQTTVTDGEKVVELSRAYRNPVVFVQPPTQNEADATVPRLLDVQSDRFTVKLQDAPDETQTHASETVSYVVLEAGRWELPSGAVLEVGTVATDATQGATLSSWESVSFSVSFSSTPVVLSQVQTYRDPHFAKTRQTSVTTSGFSVALEEDELQTARHGEETIGWMAMSAGSGSWSGHTYVAAQTSRSVNGNWTSISFSGVGFTAAPRLVAGMASYYGGDPSELRYQSLTSSSVQVRVEEDTTQDTETGHTTEEIAYLAIQGSGTLQGEALDDVVTKYHYLSGQRVAMRTVVDGAGELVYLHGDHLGSASLTTDASGSVVSRMRYYPYGETRSGSVATDRRYTGQRQESSLELMDYRARYYDGALGRFVQADTIIPEPGNPQSLNRFAYVYGNPLRYVDPTGHDVGCPGMDCADYAAASGQMWGQASDVPSWLLEYSLAVVRDDPEYFDNAATSVWDQADMVSQAAQRAYEDDVIDRDTYLDWHFASRGWIMEQSDAQMALFVEAQTDQRTQGLMTVAAPEPELAGWSARPGDMGDATRVSLGRGTTGRTLELSLQEKLAMESVQSDPSNGKVLPLKLDDPRWHWTDGWVKMSRTAGGVEVHWNANPARGLYDDFKFK